VHALALVALLPRFWSVQAVATLVILYWVTACLGVTIGYHRLLSHRSFRVPRWLERFFATCGALSCQHGPIDWVGLHRHHHKFSDTDADHHDSNKGFWWSHMGWMFITVPALAAVPRLTGDLALDPYHRWLNRWFLALQLPLAGLLFWIGTITGAGGWALVLWGIPLRLAVVYHVTWLVNPARASAARSTSPGSTSACCGPSAWPPRCGCRRPPIRPDASPARPRRGRWRRVNDRLISGSRSLRQSGHGQARPGGSERRRPQPRQGR
jgi:hypothetical protein